MSPAFNEGRGRALGVLRNANPTFTQTAPLLPSINRSVDSKILRFVDSLLMLLLHYSPYKPHRRESTDRREEIENDEIDEEDGSYGSSGCGDDYRNSSTSHGPGVRWSCRQFCRRVSARSCRSRHLFLWSLHPIF